MYSVHQGLKRKSWSAGETWNSSSCLGDSPVVFGQEFTTLTCQTGAIPSKSWHCFGEVGSILASKLPRFVPYLHPNGTGWYSPNGTKSCHVFSSHSQHIPRPHGPPCSASPPPSVWPQHPGSLGYTVHQGIIPFCKNRNGRILGNLCVLLHTFTILSRSLIVCLCMSWHDLNYLKLYRHSRFNVENMVKHGKTW